MKKWIALMAASALLTLTACGGGGSDSDGAAAPVVSTLSFPIRDAYHTMMDPDQPIALNLAGTDNAVIEPSVTQVDWPSWSKLPPPPPDSVPGDLRWVGTVTAQRRAVSILVTTYEPQPTATTAVDYFISLKRLRDGREYRDALTVFFDADYRPLAAVTMPSRVWTWATPLDGLPGNGRIGKSSGTAIATSCGLSAPPSLTELGCSDGTSGAIPAVWTLQPDTAQTAFITFAYRSPFLDAIDGSDSFERSEAIVEIKTKIDGAGAFKGVEYVRIEGPLTIRLKG